MRTLYILNTSLLNPITASKDTRENEKVVSHPSSISFASPTVSTNMIDVCLWHRSLGHGSITTVHHISFLSNKDLKNVRDCNIITLAKQHRLPFSTSEISTIRILYFLHLDLWGPYRQMCYTRASFMLTIVDDYSRATWTYLLSHKSQALTIFKHFLNMIFTQFQKHIKVLRSDNGGEFTSKDFKAYLL